MGPKDSTVKMGRKHTLKNRIINNKKGHMITSKEQEEIEKLVKIGFSQRQIEKKTLINRTTISSFIARSLEENINLRSVG